MKFVARFELYFLFAVSIVAGLWFFGNYSAQNPKSAVEVNYTAGEIQKKAVKYFTNIGFSIDDYTISDVIMEGNKNLLDSLQHHLGRAQAIQLLKDSSITNLKPYFWEITFERKDTELTQFVFGEGSQNIKENEIQLQIDPQGRFIALVNPSEHLPLHQVNREALKKVFGSSSGKTGQEVISTLPDSLLKRLLNFDDDYSTPSIAGQVDSLNQGIWQYWQKGIQSYEYTLTQVRGLAQYHLAQAGWQTEALVQDSVFVKHLRGVDAIAVQYTNAESLLGQQLQLDVVMAPAGALLQLEASYNVAEVQQERINFLRDTFRGILIVLFIIVVIVLFFFRIKARVVDTKSALVVAIMMGAAVIGYSFLDNIGEGPFLNGTIDSAMSLVLLIWMGISGAFASLYFFMLFAVGDSMTREYWPRKLWGVDYIRQGMFFNKPLGMALLRSVALAFILAGCWTAILQLQTYSYFSVETVFTAQNVRWGPVYLLLHSNWLSFMVTSVLFLIIASGLYGKKGRKWLAGAATAIASGCITPILGAPSHIFVGGFLLGIALFCIYYRWGFLTVFMAHLLFIALMDSASGWVIPNSFDSHIFMSVLWFIGILIIVGILSVYYGKEGRTLSVYQPKYVDELAEEKHIKQELNIARQVQQSFLPTKIPQLEGLDVAAICEPANETGGDYYDFIQLDDHRAAIAVGDVSGKGIQAAFYMTFVKGLLHSLSQETYSPAEVLKKANRLFCDNSAKGTFISLIYGIIDLQAGTFTFARAGHNPILHLNRSTGLIEELQPDGLGIGLTKGEKFDNKIQEIELSITADDLFLLYTDGIVEALNNIHEFYGTDRLIPIVDGMKDDKAEAIISVVSQQVRNFIGQARQHDDMTLMAIRFPKNL